MLLHLCKDGDREAGVLLETFPFAFVVVAGVAGVIFSATAVPIAVRTVPLAVAVRTVALTFTVTVAAAFGGGVGGTCG